MSVSSDEKTQADRIAEDSRMKGDDKNRDNGVAVRALAALPTAAMAVDGRGRITSWNGAAAELTGRPAEDVIGQKAWRAFFEERTQTPIELVLRSEDVESNPQFTFRHAKSGAEQVVHFVAQPMFDDEGELDGAVASLSAEASGEQHRAEEDLDNLPTPVVRIDREFGVTYINKAGAAAVGVEPAEAIGKRCYDLFQTPHCNTDECRCGQAMRRDGTFTGDTIARPNGTEIPIRYTASPVKDTDGNIVGALEFVVDTTEQTEAFDHAAARADYLNNVPTPVVAVDRDFSIRFINRAGADVLGKYVDAIVGEKCFNLFKTPHCNTPDCRVAQAMERNGVFTGETVADPSGRNLPIRYTGAPLCNDAGDIVGGLEYVLDITEEVQAREEISRLVTAAQQGILNIRGDVDAFGEEYRHIIRDINSMMDALAMPIRTASATLSRLAKYDLKARVRGEYTGEFAKMHGAINQTAEALHQAMTQVADAADQVNAASDQIAESSQTVARGTTQQASSLQETAASLEEMSSMTRQNSDNTQQAKAQADSARNAAEQGSESMEKMLAAMRDIRASAEATAQIIKDINEIAFQTNLLALNAAVEAARAGDAGRGFAVVAEEVRNLAQRSKEAAQKTEELIKTSVNLAESGELTSNGVSGNLSEIVDAVNRVSSIVAEVAAASDEQAKGIEQVNIAVNEMDKVTQDSAASAEETASAAEELSSQATELASMVGRFEMDRPAALSPSCRGDVASPVQHRRRIQASGRDGTDRNGNGNGNGNGTGHGQSGRRPEDVIPFDDEAALRRF